MKYLFYFLVSINTAFAYDHAIKLTDSDELSKSSVILQYRKPPFDKQAFKQMRKKSPTPGCTGVIISPNKILTLFYCLHFYKEQSIDIKNVTVAFGVDGKNPIATRKIKKITPHPLARLTYDTRNKPFDVVVVELDQPIPEQFKPIQMSELDDNALIEKLPFDIFVVGAGGEERVRRRKFKPLNHLRFVRQAGIFQNFDERYTRYGKAYILCLDNEGFGYSFPADLGGPAVAYIDGIPTLIGLGAGMSGNTSDYQVPGSCAGGGGLGVNRTAIQPINKTVSWIKGLLK